jgi:protein-S-isoprenylcysteine O-methyltransferase Ste14
LLFGDGRLAVYGAFVWLAFHIFVVAYEEPTLARQFGSEYRSYRAGVSRWLPRLNPWKPEKEGPPITGL